ncbi:VOC family protein [Candidatus Bathyarchaeota archaeon]|nr:MAG: VOC family protein [Candidatus Bathyarchaeota archaeon]TMI32329.1 MAG: VOC family protein [Candidatus Bathyarchaeota archaeon]
MEETMRKRKGQTARHTKLRWDLKEVTYFVSDFKLSQDFYEGILGMRKRLTQDGYTQFDVDGIAFAIHKAELSGEKAGRENHIAFRVAFPQKVDEIFELLKERGVKFEPYRSSGMPDQSTSPGPKDFEWGKRGIFFRDPDGNLLEVYADLG